MLSRGKSAECAIAYGTCQREGNRRELVILNATKLAMHRVIREVQDVNFPEVRKIEMLVDAVDLEFGGYRKNRSLWAMQHATYCSV